MKNTYFVNVGNIGNIEENNKRDAIKTFRSYVIGSKMGYGRGSQENVCIFMNDEPMNDYDFDYKCWKQFKLLQKIDYHKNQIQILNAIMNDINKDDI